MVGSFALVAVLSTFNGFEEVVSKLYNTFESDIRITPVQGKYFVPDGAKMARLKAIKGVWGITPVIEDNAMLYYRDGQNVSSFKAIEPSYLHTTGMDTMVYSGHPMLRDRNVNYALVGAGVAGRLGLRGFDREFPLKLYIPRKGVEFSQNNPEYSMNQMSIVSGGIFSVQQEFDSKYILVPLAFGRELIEDPKSITAIEINIKNDRIIPQVQAEVQRILGADFKVEDRFQQQPLLYKVMRTEKLSVYLVLSFILLIAAFNLIGALLMLAIEKQGDMAVLMSMGAQPVLIRNIILMEGLILSVGGALLGMGLGFIVCWLQMKYGFLKLSEGTTFVINAYPVAFKWMDFVVIFITVLGLGFLASYYPAMTVNKRVNVQMLRSKQ